MTRVNAILKRETIAHILLQEVKSSGDNAGNIAYKFFEVIKLLSNKKPS